jgi:hypothetical protein
VNQLHKERQGRRLLAAVFATCVLLFATAQSGSARTELSQTDPSQSDSPRVEFGDVTATAGLGRIDGGSVAWRDLDGDSLPDFVVTNEAGVTNLYMGDGSGFTRTRLDGVVATTTGPGTASLTDLDGDTDGDLAVLDSAGSASQFLENVDGVITARRVVTGDVGPSSGGVWLDVDNDAKLDLFLAGTPDGIDPSMHVQRTSALLRAEIESFEASEPQVVQALYRELSNGDLELLTGGTRFPSHRFVLSGSGPSYSAVTDAELTNTVEVLAGDLDGDNVDELLVLRANRGAAVSSNEDLTEITVVMLAAAGTESITVSSDEPIDVSIDPLPGHVRTSVAVGANLVNRSNGFVLDSNTQPVAVAGSGLFVGATTDEDRAPAQEGTWQFVLNSASVASAVVTMSSDSPIDLLTGDLLTGDLLSGDTRSEESGADWDVALERRADGWGVERPFDSRTDCASGVLADFDNDGDIDVFLACGTVVEDLPERLFVNQGRGTFVEQTLGAAVGLGAGADATVTTADFDGDGFVDVLLSSADRTDRVQLLRNVPNGHHWLKIDLVGQQSNTDAIGAVVIVVVDGSSQRRDQRGGQQRRNQSDRTLHFGLGESEQIDRIVVLWPTGRRQVVDDVAADQVLRLVEPDSDDPFADVELANLAFDPVVEVGARSEIQVDATNTGIGIAVGTVVEFELPEGWIALGLPAEVSTEANMVRWQLADLGPGQIARLSLAARAGDSAESGTLTITAIGPFPTQRISRDVLMTESANGLTGGLTLVLIIGGIMTIVAAVFLAIRRARNDELDTTWYETAVDLSDSPLIEPG